MILLDTAIFKIHGLVNAFPGIRLLRLTPAQVSHRRLCVGHAPVFNVAALVNAFYFSILCLNDHVPPPLCPDTRKCRFSFPSLYSRNIFFSRQFLFQTYLKIVPSDFQISL